MYGTVAKIRIKPGMDEQLAERERSMAANSPQIPGFVAQYVYRMDADPDELYLVVLFESKEAYQANAASPDQAGRYEQMVAMMAAPPEWHDGEIISAYPSHH